MFDDEGIQESAAEDTFGEKLWVQTEMHGWIHFLCNAEEMCYVKTKERTYYETLNGISQDG